MIAEQTPLRTIRLYDTMSRQKRTLEPLKPGCLSMYVCGVTVYDLTHIGHARTFIFFDVVQRFLRYLGYDVTFVRNHTDVDDKIIKRAEQLGEEPLALSARFIDAFRQDMGALYVEEADVEPLVSQTIPEIIEMVQELIDRSFAYESQGDVYYRVRNFERYGALSGRKLEDMEAGRSGRTDADETQLKEHPFDFALWKSSRGESLSWDSPWGPGRPGWHIECSAMSRKHLGDSFDLHGGGQDLTFPHHENEIAQSEACTGHHPYARNWMHVAMVNIDGVKMSKSLNNFWTTRDVLEHYHPETIRFFMLSTHYRNPINYSTDTLNEATRRVVYLYDVLARAQEVLARVDIRFGEQIEPGPHVKERVALLKTYEQRFEEAMSDDFNTALALSLIQELAKASNDLTNSKKKPQPEVIRTLLLLRELMVKTAAPLGLLQRDPQEVLLELRDLSARAMNLDTAYIDQRIQDRTDARADKRWADADAIRDELAALNVEIMDNPQGTTWRIKYDPIEIEG